MNLLRPYLNEEALALLESRVTVKATGLVGLVDDVMPDKDGAPWSLSVIVDGTCEKLVCSPEEVEPLPGEVN